MLLCSIFVIISHIGLGECHSCNLHGLTKEYTFCNALLHWEEERLRGHEADGGERGSPQFLQTSDSLFARGAEANLAAIGIRTRMK